MKILLVEDDAALASGLQQALRHAGFAVDHVTRGRDALHVFQTEPPDITILDLGLPDVDGLLVLAKLRAGKNSMPVLILTARDSTADKVAGLDHGADDYLIKPFEMSELLARLRAMERRIGTATSARIQVAGVELDTLAMQVRVKHVALDFSRREYMLLKALMENAGRIQTRERLESELYSWGEEVSSNAIEVHIHNIRKKLPMDFIKTIRGVGYTIKKS